MFLEMNLGMNSVCLPGKNKQFIPHSIILVKSQEDTCIVFPWFLWQNTGGMTGSEANILLKF